MEEIKVKFWNSPYAESIDGGEYHYEIIASNSNGRYELKFFSSSEFGICPTCGRFHDKICSQDPIVLDGFGIYVLLAMAKQWEAQIIIDDELVYEGRSVYTQMNFIPRFINAVLLRIEKGIYEDD